MSKAEWKAAYRKYRYNLRRLLWVQEDMLIFGNGYYTEDAGWLTYIEPASMRFQ